MKLEQLPPHMIREPAEVYRASKMKYVGFLLMCLVFFTIGVWMLCTQHPGLYDRMMSIFCIVLFGGLGLLCLRQLLPGRAELKATPEGLSVRSMFQTITYRWSDIEKFGVTEFTIKPGGPGNRPEIIKGHVPGGAHFRRVGFNFSGSYCGGGLVWRNKDYNQEKCGFDGLLPDAYDMSCDELAEHLNQLRAKYEKPA